MDAMRSILRWKVICSFAVVSLTSGFIGATLALWWVGRAPPPLATADGTSSGRVDDLYVTHLRTYLGLTGEQTARVGEIVQGARGEALESADEAGAVARARRRMLSEIREVLTPEQRARFERLTELRSRGLGGRKGRDKSL